MKAYRGVEVKLHSFITSALDGGQWLSLDAGRFTPGKNTGSYWAGRCVEPKAGLDVSGKRTVSST